MEQFREDEYVVTRDGDKVDIGLSASAQREEQAKTHKTMTSATIYKGGRGWSMDGWKDITIMGTAELAEEEIALLEQHRNIVKVSIQDGHYLTHLFTIPEAEFEIFKKKSYREMKKYLVAKQKEEHRAWLASPEYARQQRMIKAAKEAEKEVEE